MVQKMERNLCILDEFLDLDNKYVMTADSQNKVTTMTCEEQVEKTFCLPVANAIVGWWK